MKYTEDVEIEKSLLDFSRRPPTPKVLAKSAVVVRFDLDVHLSRGVRIENNLAAPISKATSRSPAPSRSIGLLAASIRFWAPPLPGNEFQIEQGVLTFTDRQRIAELRPPGQRAGEEVKVRLHAFGTPGEPHLSLSSDPMLAEGDLGFLLTFGFVSTNLQAQHVLGRRLGLAIGSRRSTAPPGSRRGAPLHPQEPDPPRPSNRLRQRVLVGHQPAGAMARFQSGLLSDRLDLHIMQGLKTRRYRGRGRLSALGLDLRPLPAGQRAQHHRHRHRLRARPPPEMGGRLVARPSLCALPRAGVAPGANPRGEVVFEGADAESVRALVEVQPGQLLDARDVRDAVRALHASARFSRVAAYAEAHGRRARAADLVLTGIEKLVSVSFTGHRALAHSVLLQNANLQVNAEFQPEQVGPAVEAVQAAYFRIGYRHAQVTPVRRAARAVWRSSFASTRGRRRASRRCGSRATWRSTRPARRCLQDRAGRRVETWSHSKRPFAGSASATAWREVAGPASTRPASRGGRERGAHRGPVGRGRWCASTCAETGPSPTPCWPHTSFSTPTIPSTPSCAGAAGRLRRFYVTAGFLRARSPSGRCRPRRRRRGGVSIDEGLQVRVERLVITGKQAVPTGSFASAVLLLLRDTIPPHPAVAANPATLEHRTDGGGSGGPPAPHHRGPETVFDPVCTRAH